MLFVICCTFFACTTMEEKELKELLATKCPECLYPYARALISNLIMQGGFPSMDLPPMDFKALYKGQHENKAKEKK